ncbi:hypothetical protein M2360_004381 [Rhizobium sp. SG_E_25_P2]|uniref:hypothetical protein n=1 Tax=Rhizobium sp. SG_E_25_P2 TaxID=2879942 RepID=UPI002474C283|nr:hypothetical protein [Rhizobium sp. SG_E_25_P2]MDH6268961.1 hypothetical protein [Rhizobium sp. SG_E_25_P2]
MLGLFLRVVVILAAGVLLSACGARPKSLPEVTQIYEVRAALVTGNAGAPKKLMTAIQDRLDDAIAATVRPVPMPRAVMTVHIVDVQQVPTEDGLQTQTEISVMLSDVVSGHPLHVKSYLVLSLSVDNRAAKWAAAEAIAARLRSEYRLNQPPIVKRLTHDPRLSTKMRGPLQPGEQPVAPAAEPQVEPIVIPLKNAPVVGADQDPLLNSKTPVSEPTAPATVPQAGLNGAAQPEAAAPATVEDGAKAKVVIMPKKTETPTPPETGAQADVAPQPKQANSEPPADAPADDSEPCVETLEKKC